MTGYRFVFRNDTEFPASDLSVLFSLRFGEPIEFQGSIPKSKSARQSSESRAVRVVFEAPVLPGEDVKVYVSAAGGAVQVAERRFGIDNGMESSMGRTPRNTPYSEIRCWRKEQEQRSLFPAQCSLFNLMETQTQQDDPSLWRDPDSGGPLSTEQVADREQVLRHLLAYLRAGFCVRSRQRREQRRRPRPPDDIYAQLPYPGSDGPSRDLQKDLDLLSRVFLWCFRQSSSSTAASAGPERIVHGIDCGFLADSFQRFARGDLAMDPRAPSDCLTDEPNLTQTPAMREFMQQCCQPDSGFFFLWAELAGLLAESQTADNAVWAELLPALVQSQKEFSETYGTDSRYAHDWALAYRAAPVENPAPWPELRARRDQLRRCTKDELNKIWVYQAASLIGC